MKITFERANDKWRYPTRYAAKIHTRLPCASAEPRTTRLPFRLPQRLRHLPRLRRHQLPITCVVTSQRENRLRYLPSRHWDCGIPDRVEDAAREFARPNKTSRFWRGMAASRSRS